MTCDDATWVDLKSEYDLSVMLRALASKGGSSLNQRKQIQDVSEPFSDSKHSFAS